MSEEPVAGQVTIEEHRWYSVVRVNGEFWRAFAGGREFSGLGTFDDEAAFERWLGA